VYRVNPAASLETGQLQAAGKKYEEGVEDDFSGREEKEILSSSKKYVIDTDDTCDEIKLLADTADIPEMICIDNGSEIIEVVLTDVTCSPSDTATPTGVVSFCNTEKSAAIFSNSGSEVLLEDAEKYSKECGDKDRNQCASNTTEENECGDKATEENECGDKATEENESGDKATEENKCGDKATEENERGDKETEDKDCEDNAIEETEHGDKETEDNECGDKVKEENECGDKETKHDCGDKPTEEYECGDKAIEENVCNDKSIEENVCDDKAIEENERGYKANEEEKCDDKSKEENECGNKATEENEYGDKTSDEKECSDKPKEKNECGDKATEFLSTGSGMVAMSVQGVGIDNSKTDMLSEVIDENNSVAGSLSSSQGSLPLPDQQLVQSRRPSLGINCKII
jgi:hypothetical protein